MEKSETSAREIAAKIQLLYNTSLDSMLLEGKRLIESLPSKQPYIVQHIFLSTAERVFILVQDTSDSFQTGLEGGYFTTATLTRGLMEAATTLALLSRDRNGDIASAYLRQQELLASKRHKSLLKLHPAKNSKLAAYAKTESAISGRELETLRKVRTNAKLPPAKNNFPDMAGRCRVLGEHWEFLYHVVYRDLSEAVHGSFFKTLLTPGIARSTPNQGDGLVFEHCRAFGNAFEFWVRAVVECCQNHPDKEAVGIFCQKLSRFLDADARLINGFPASARRHQIAV